MPDAIRDKINTLHSLIWESDSSHAITDIFNPFIVELTIRHSLQVASFTNLEVIPGLMKIISHALC